MATIQHCKRGHKVNKQMESEWEIEKVRGKKGKKKKKLGEVFIDQRHRRYIRA